MMSSPTPLLEVADVTARLRDSAIPLLENVSFSLRPNAITGLVGETGSGKSLLASTILGIAPEALEVLSGRIRFAGQDLLHLPPRQLRDIRGARISIVFQDPFLALNPVLTVGRQIADVARRHLGLSKGEARKSTIRMLHRVRIPEPEIRMRQYPHEFSGGMAQRAMIAMALIAEPELIILDEPTTGLDVAIQAEILTLLQELVEEGVTALLITHDLGVVAQVCQDMIVMRKGCIVDAGPTRRIFEESTHPYTRRLVAAAEHLSTGKSTP